MLLTINKLRYLQYPQGVTENITIMEKTLKGSLDYEITATEENYSFNFSRSPSNDMGALVAVLEIVKANKERLEVNKKEFRGTDKIEFQKRLADMRTTLEILRLITEHRVREWMSVVEEIKTPENETAEKVKEAN